MEKNIAPDLFQEIYYKKGMKTIKESILGSTRTGRTELIKTAIEEAKKNRYLIFDEYKINPDFTVSLGAAVKVIYDARWKLPFKIKEIYNIYRTPATKFYISNLSDPEILKNLPEETDFISFEYLDKNIKDISSIKTKNIKFIYCDIDRLPVMQSSVDTVEISHCSIKSLKNLCKANEYVILGCNNIKDLDGVVSDSRTKIHIEDCRSLESLEGIKGDSCLYLIANDCKKLKSLSCSLDFCHHFSVEANPRIKNFRGCPDTDDIQIYNMQEIDDPTIFPTSEEFKIFFSKKADRSKLPADLEDRIKKASGAKKIIIHFS